MTTTQDAPVFTEGAGTVRYTATVMAAQLLVTRDIVAGVSGPYAEFPRPHDLDGVVAKLAEFGFTVVGSWRFVKSFEGLWLEADLDLRS